MNPGQPDVAEQVPAGGGMNKPTSGAYGEGAALDRLKEQLPVMDPAAAAPAGQEPRPMGPGPGGPPPSTPGLPPSIMGPSLRPSQPVSTPLAQPNQMPFPGSPNEQRLQLLNALASAPDVSDETREFASMLRDSMLRRG